MLQGNGFNEPSGSLKSYVSVGHQMGYHKEIGTSCHLSFCFLNGKVFLWLNNDPGMSSQLSHISCVTLVSVPPFLNRKMANEKPFLFYRDRNN